ncbi:MAG TPA: ABC transporter substrate-binding protein [Burkholderiales bacterium]
MRATRSLLFLSVLLGLFLQRAVADELPPDVLVKTVTLEVVDIIAKDREIKSSKAKLVSLVNAKVLPHFDFVGMTRLAVGPAWNKATPEQRNHLSEQFKTLLVRTYSSALAAYSDQKFEFRPLRMKPGESDVTVTVRVLQHGAQPVAIEYSMEKTSTGWKVYDMLVGGVSLVANYRTEFANKIQRAGVDGLIRELQAKNRSQEI